MRPAGKAELDSLYFDYPKYEWERPYELDGQTPLHPVVIAGAGPVGLTAAIALARRGIASVLLEKKDTLNDGSRAICVSRYSYETLQQLGLHEPFVAKGLGWTHGQCTTGTQQFIGLRCHTPIRSVSCLCTRFNSNISSNLWWRRRTNIPI